MQVDAELHYCLLTSVCVCECVWGGGTLLLLRVFDWARWRWGGLSNFLLPSLVHDQWAGGGVVVGYGVVMGSWCVVLVSVNQ